MNSKLSRLQVILSILNSQYGHIGVTAHSLAEKLEVSDKTVSRDLGQLNCMFNEYLLNHRQYPYLYDDETEPIHFDWSRRSYRLRRELIGVGLGQLLNLN